MSESPYFHEPMQVELTGETKHGRPIWKTVKDLHFTCWLDGERRDITVPAGFATDFASVPRFFWRFAPPGGKYAAASVVHDYLYLNKIGDREQADKIFSLAMQAAEVKTWRRKLIYKAVRTFGGKGWGS